MAPPRRNPPDVAEERRRENRLRIRKRNAIVARWLNTHHPRLYNKALAEAEEQITQERGPLPGAPP